MTDTSKIKQQLIDELHELRKVLQQASEKETGTDLADHSRTHLRGQPEWRSSMSAAG